MSCMVVSSWVSQVCSSLKPWFLSLSMLCLSRWSQTLTNDVFEQLTGYRRQWNWSIVVRFAPVALLEHTGDVCSQPVDGSCPVCTDRLKLKLSAGTVVSIHSFSTLLGILSGPHALDRFRFQRSFATPSVLMTKSVLGTVQIPSWAAESHHLLRIRSWPGWEGSWPWWCCHWREQCLSSRGLIVCCLGILLSRTSRMAWCCFASFPFQSPCSHAGSLLSSSPFYNLSWSTYSYSSCCFSGLAWRVFYSFSRVSWCIGQSAGGQCLSSGVLMECAFWQLTSLPSKTFSHLLFTSAPSWSTFTIVSKRGFRSVLRSSYLVLRRGRGILVFPLSSEDRYPGLPLLPRGPRAQELMLSIVWVVGL